MEIKRRKSKKIFVGNIAIGGDSPVSIQSMAKTDTRDVSLTVRQIKRLERAGCELIRVAVLNDEAARAIAKIKQKIKIPLVADIHFDYRLAILAVQNGADKIRLNPGNISQKAQIEKIIKCAAKYKVPIRIGLNSGSVKRTGQDNLVNDLVFSGLAYFENFKKLGFEQIIFSLKTPEVLTTIEAYRRMAELTGMPLHLGLTATGLPQTGIIKSAVGIGVLLSEGIGDTIRVSLTADPVYEIEAAKEILTSLNLRPPGIEVISCPTCGRCKINLIKMVKQIQKKLSDFNRTFSGRRLRVAIMGCIVNGPGEAKDADIGIAWGGTAGILFKKGLRVRLIKENKLIETLLAEVKNEMV